LHQMFTLVGCEFQCSFEDLLCSARHDPLSVPRSREEALFRRRLRARARGATWACASSAGGP
jgi:hypothetical protein